jgi:hypothetical protein
MVVKQITLKLLLLGKRLLLGGGLLLAGVILPYRDKCGRALAGAPNYKWL